MADFCASGEYVMCLRYYLSKMNRATVLPFESLFDTQVAWSILP